MIRGSVYERTAARTALALRLHRRTPMTEALCVYDLAAELGVDVRFTDTPSLEGMYVRDNPAVILVTVHRPVGRQTMTCAHELGHHRLGHGTLIDGYLENPGTGRSIEERQAYVFAAHLLMPRAAVIHGFEARGSRNSDPSADAAYEVASWLGVGYSALLYHMHAGLGLLSSRRARELADVQPAEIKERLLGQAPVHDVYIAGPNWIGRPIDLKVGDDLLAPSESHFEGACAARTARGHQAIRPGIGRLSASDGSWSSFVRVSRREYVGLAAYRHLEDAE